MNRGAGRCNIVNNNDQRELFIELLAELPKRFDIEIHAYCLMGNHYHLLLKTPSPCLSEAMKHLSSLYTKRFNRMSKSDGPLFRGRFKAVIIDADDYLVQVSRYIHRNPVEAKMVEKADEYPWSSFRAYINPDEIPEWLHTAEVLKRVYFKNRTHEYEKLVNSPLMPSLKDFYDKKHVPSVLGSKYFRSKLPSQQRNNKDIDEKGELAKLHQIIEHTAAYFGIDPREILAKKLGQPNRARFIALAVCQQKLMLPLSTIGDCFGVTKSAISATLRRRKAQLLEKDNKRAIKNILCTLEQM